VRQLLEARAGQRLYVFTTLGQVYVGVLQEINNDVVELRAPDRQTPVFIHLTDISGVRTYDLDDDRSAG
jgi:hypothetical protein